MLIFISSGQTSSGINLTSDTIDVLSGGLATHTTVNSDGELYVSKGGTATDTTINPDGYLAVLSGGLATRTTVNSGGFLCVYSGGLASSTAVCFGGQMALEGGTATGTTVNNGYLFVYSSSYLEDIQFQGDVDYLQGEENGRTLSNVRICENTRVYVGANIQGLTVEAGGFTDYQWGGSAFGVDVYGSLQLWNPFGNTDLVYAEDMVIHSGGYVAAGRAAFVSKTIVSSGGRLYLNYSTEEEKGTAKDTYVLEGGVASASSVGNYFLGYLRIGGRVSVYSAQVLKDVGSIDFELGDVSSNSYLYVADGSLAGATVITADVTNAFGKYTLIEGGSANLQTITVTNDNTSSALSVGQTISVSAVKSVTLTVSNNNLYLQVSINDTTPPDLPGNIGATLDGNVLSMHWDSVTDLTGVVYEVEYSNDPGFADNVFTETFTTAGGTLTLGNGDWYWRIRSKDGAGNYSAWSKSSSATINHTDIVEGRFVQPQDFSSDVIIKPTAVVECAYPAAIRLNSSDSTVTVEGGTLSCNSIRNACILFGEDADTTGNSHLLHSDGTVTFTGAQAVLDSKVSGDITAAGIVGLKLTVNFSAAADKSTGISFHCTNDTGPGYAAYAIYADDSLTINGTFGGTAVSFFDFSKLNSQHWSEAGGFFSMEELTINGGISGTVLAYAYASENALQYAYGLISNYRKNLTITGDISGTIAAFGLYQAFALYGGGITATISGTLIAGKSQADQDETAVLALISDPVKNMDTLKSLCANDYALCDSGYGTSAVTVKSSAKIFGNVNIYSGDALFTVSSNALITGTVNAGNLTINLEGISDTAVFQQGWSSYTTTICADSAQNGTYILSDNDDTNRSITIVCGSESKKWTSGTAETFTFQNGKKITISKGNHQLVVTAAGFENATDTTPPDISAVSLNTAVDNNSVTVSWTPATDNVGVTQYRIRYAPTASPDNAIQLVLSADQTQTMITSLRNGQYTLQLQAGDADGNWSEWTAAKTFTIDVVSAIVTLPYEIPHAEYMYGCVPTSLGMLLGYYDLYGYKGHSLDNLIPGSVDINSRGTDGNAYDMDAFDTVLGNFIASPEYVSRFIAQTPEAELPYTFVNGNPEQGLNVAVFNSLADWIGTGQYWRSNGDLGTTHFKDNLTWLDTTTQTQSIASLSVPAKYLDFKWGLSQYLLTVGYKLDAEKTKTTAVDCADGTFTFEDYMAEIDAGRPILISVNTADNEGHMMVGYGYNAATREIIFDDTYKTDMKMTWGDAYFYSNKYFYLDSVTTIVFDESSLGDASFENGAENMEITGNVFVTGNDAIFSDIIASGTIFGGTSSPTPENRTLEIYGSTAKRFVAGGSFDNIEQTDENAITTVNISNSTFSGGLFGGADAFHATINSDVNLAAEETTANIIFAGSNIKAGTKDNPNAVTLNCSSSLVLTDCISTNYVAGSSLISNFGNESRCGNINLDIIGGTHKQVIGGSLIQCKGDSNPYSSITGDICITVSGAAKISALYGGSGALYSGPTKNESIHGDICIALDLSQGASITDAIVGGGAGYCTVDGNVIVFIGGAGQGKDFLGTTTIMGDSANATWGTPYVSGTRALSFTNFTGTVTSRIFRFDEISIDARSSVSFTYIPSELAQKNWSIMSDNPYKVSVNLPSYSDKTAYDLNFSGSELYLYCELLEEHEWTIFRAAGDSMDNQIFGSLDNASSIMLNGDELAQTDEFIFEGTDYMLEYRFVEEDDTTYGMLVASKLA